MRIKYLLHLCYCLALAGCALWATPVSISAQWLPTDPTSPIAPTENSQCNDLWSRWSELVSEIDRLHDQCLAANRENKAPRNPRSGSGRNSTCDYGSCQSLHTRLFDSEDKRDKEVEGCRDRVEKHQENKRRQQEAEQERQREVKEREERERAERKEREAKKREQADADKQKRSDEAERRREREEANQQRLRRAAEQQQREREALARRTEERQKQMEDLRKREGDVNDRYGQAVEKQTRDAQDALLAQMQSRAGTENSIFPTTDSRKNDGAEFDLSSSAGRNSAGSLPQLSSEYDEAIAPPRDSYFSAAFQNVRDFVSPIVEKGRELFVEELRDIARENVNEVRDTIITGVFNNDESARAAESIANKFFEGYKDPVRDIVSSAAESAAGGLVDEAAADIARTVATSVGLRPESGGLVGALTDVAVKNGAEKLSDYARETFVDSMTAKFSDAYKNISERILGPSDPITQPVQDTALLRLPGLVSKMGNPAAATKAIYDYGINMVNAMDEMFDRLIKSEFFGTAPPDSDPNK